MNRITKCIIFSPVISDSFPNRISARVSRSRQGKDQSRDRQQSPFDSLGESRIAFSDTIVHSDSCNGPAFDHATQKQTDRDFETSPESRNVRFRLHETVPSTAGLLTLILIASTRPLIVENDAAGLNSFPLILSRLRLYYDFRHK